MTTDETPGTIWRKASRSGNTGNCVEVTALPGQIGVRDSKHPENGHIEVGRTRFAAFAKRVKTNRL